jgi:hypothetical protein
MRFTALFATIAAILSALTPGSGQVRELLDILTASSFEGFASRPTAASYS